MWDVVAELVKLCTYPSPRNPFAIDYDYFSMLPLSERVLATAAMVNLLQKILIHTPDQKMYAGQGMYHKGPTKECWPSSFVLGLSVCLSLRCCGHSD